MKTVKLGQYQEVRLPEEITRRLKLRRGSRLAVISSGEGVYLVPLRRIPKDQRYFYTDAWQEMEREATEDIKARRVKEFSGADDLIRDLRDA